MANKKPPKNEIVNGRGLQLRNLPEMRQFADAIVKSGQFAKSYKSPEQVIIAIQAGAELAMGPIEALGSFYVVNGQPRLYNDAPLAFVMASGQLEAKKEFFEGESWDDLVAVCKLKRKGLPGMVERRFSVNDAKRAGLWGTKDTWSKYPKRMLQMRARSWAIRDLFPDCLRGMTIAEEYYGVEEESETASKITTFLDERKTKKVECTTKPPTEDWTPEDAPGEPVGESPPKWRCLDRCANEFAVPLVGGLCPKCLGKRIEEIEDES
jgi:hypothetical protein